MSDFDTIFGYMASALILTGGTLGYLRRGSVASLVAGGGSGVAMAYGVRRQQLAPKDVYVIVAVSVLLLVAMGPRFARSGKVMPAGLVVMLAAATLFRFGMRLL